MKRFASTRSEKRASHPLAGRAQCSVGSIDEDGIRYGLTTQALIASTIAIAPTIVTTQSIVTRQPCGRPRVSRSTGLRECRSGCGGVSGSDGVTNGSGNDAGSDVAVGAASAAAVGLLGPERVPRGGDRERGPEQVEEAEHLAQVLAEEREHLAREQPGLGAEVLLRVLDGEGEAEVLAEQDAEQRRHDRDRLQVGRAAAAGGALDGEAGQEADAPGDDPDLVVGVLGDQAPRGAADDRRDQACEQREAGGAALLGLDRRRRRLRRLLAGSRRAPSRSARSRSRGPHLVGAPLPALLAPPARRRARGRRRAGPPGRSSRGTRPAGCSAGTRARPRAPPRSSRARRIPRRAHRAAGGRSRRAAPSPAARRRRGRRGRSRSRPRRGG